MFESVALRVAFTALILLAAAATVWLVVAAVGIRRVPGISSASRVQAAVVSLASLAAVWGGLAFWVPVAWRSSDGGIDQLARRIHEAGIPVQTTLVVYDALGGPGRLRLVTPLASRALRRGISSRYSGKG